MSQTVATKSIFSAALIVSFGMLLGRLTGFLREIVLASHFGVSVDADIAVLLLTLPDLIITLFIGGAANIVLIPRFQEMLPDKRFSYFTYLSLWALGIFSIISIFLLLGKSFVINLLAPGMNLLAKEKTHSLIGWIFCIIPLTALASVSRSYLQSAYKFIITSLENFFYNSVVICGLLFLVPHTGLKGVIYSIFGGTVLRWGSQLINIFSFSNISKIKISLKEFKELKVGRDFLFSYIQALGAGTVLVLLPVIARSFGSHFIGDGAISIFNYSLKLIELPFGVAISVFSIIIFPKLSIIASKKDNTKEESLLIGRSLRFLVLFSLPIALGLSWLFLKILDTGETIFQIPKESFMSICQLAIAGFIFLPIRGLSTLHLAIMSARRDTVSPLLINSLNLFAALPIIYMSVYQWGILGVGVGLGIIYTTIFSLELYTLKKKHQISIISYFVNKNFFCSFVFSIGAFALLWWSLENISIPIGFVFSIAVLMGLLCLGVGVFLDKDLRFLFLQKICKK